MGKAGNLGEGGNEICRGGGSRVGVAGNPIGDLCDRGALGGSGSSGVHEGIMPAGGEFGRGGIQVAGLGLKVVGRASRCDLANAFLGLIKPFSD